MIWLAVNRSCCSSSRHRVRDDEVGAEGPAPAEQLGEQHDGDGDAPDVAPSRHDEQVEIAGAIEVEVRDAARERDEAHEGQRATISASSVPVSAQEGPAARFAPAPLGHERVASLREEEAVAERDHGLQGLAPPVGRDESRKGSAADSMSVWRSWASVSG